MASSRTCVRTQIYLAPETMLLQDATGLLSPAVLFSQSSVRKTQAPPAEGLLKGNEVQSDRE